MSVYDSPEWCMKHHMLKILCRCEDLSDRLTCTQEDVVFCKCMGCVVAGDFCPTTNCPYKSSLGRVVALCTMLIVLTLPLVANANTCYRGSGRRCDVAKEFVPDISDDPSPDRSSATGTK